MTKLLDNLLIRGISVPSPQSVVVWSLRVMVVLFFGMLNLLGIGLVGTYSWRTYENSKRRPLAVVGWRYSNCKQ
jgi:cytochrome bd-type quinol oxidase subunit 1